MHPIFPYTIPCVLELILPYTVHPRLVSFNLSESRAENISLIIVHKFCGGQDQLSYIVQVASVLRWTFLLKFNSEMSYTKICCFKKSFDSKARILYTTIEELKVASTVSSSKSCHQCYLLSRYEILQCGDVEKLFKKRKNADESPLYFVFIEDSLNIIKRVHIASGHGGRDRMLKELSKKYANIASDSVNLFKSLCIEWQRKRKRPTTKGVLERAFYIAIFLWPNSFDFKYV